MKLGEALLLVAAASVAGATIQAVVLNAAKPPESVLQKLQKCVTAGVPKNESYDGFEVRPLRADPGKFFVLHVWSNVRPFTSEQMHRRNAQERRCNKTAFGKSVVDPS